MLLLQRCPFAALSRKNVSTLRQSVETSPLYPSLSDLASKIEVNGTRASYLHCQVRKEL